MRIGSSTQRLVTVALLTSIVLGSWSPTADAGRRRYRGPYIERRVIVSRPMYRARVMRRPYARYTIWRSHRGPMIAGFLGGLFLGATLSNAAPHGFVYWDSYCHRGFASLEIYETHCRRHAHPHIIAVVESPDGGVAPDDDSYDPGDYEDD